VLGLPLMAVKQWSTLTELTPPPLSRPPGDRFKGRLEARRLQAELDCVRAEAAAAGARGDGLARQLVAAEAQVRRPHELNAALRAWAAAVPLSRQPLRRQS
jgi:hypothetical protein